MTILTDKTHYIVRCDYGDDVEVNLTQSIEDVKTTITEGGEDENFQVVEFNSVEGYSRDVTEDIYRAIADDKQYFEREFAMQKGS